MRFKIRMIRDADGNGVVEEDFVECDADGASVAYCKAMKSRNASEGWTPCGWEEIPDRVHEG